MYFMHVTCLMSVVDLHEREQAEGEERLGAHECYFIF